jgi:MSHA pilin protein MshC
MARRPKPVAPGFTLIELVMVILILGIVSVTMLPRFFSQDPLRTTTFYHDLLQGLRYSQLAAVTRGCRIRAEITASGYSLSQVASYSSSNFTDTVNRPGELAPYTNDDLPAGAIASAVTFVFNPSGTIEREASSTSLVSISTYSLAVGTHTLTLYGESGLVE